MIKSTILMHLPAQLLFSLTFWNKHLYFVVEKFVFLVETVVFFGRNSCFFVEQTFVFWSVEEEITKVQSDV